MMKAVLFDRDGVLNHDRPDYVYKPEHLIVYNGVKEVLTTLKSAGYLILVITNQAGISRGLYRKEDFQKCMKKVDNETGGVIDHVFYSPYHPSITESLSRKPGTLLFERAMGLYRLDPAQCYMVGDRDRDLIPAKKLGMKTIGMKRNEDFQNADYEVESMVQLLQIIPDINQSE